MKLLYWIISFFWSSSHVGLQGKEGMSQIAKKGTTKRYTQITTIPYSDYFQSINKKAVKETLKVIKEQGIQKGKIYYQYYCNEVYIREFILIFNRLRSNHYSLAASLFKIKVLDIPVCMCDKYYQDINHVLWQFKDLKDKRVSFIQQLRIYLNRWKIVVPESKRLRVLKDVHDTSNSVLGKVSHHKPHSLMWLRIVEGPWKNVALDVLAPLPPAEIMVTIIVEIG